jgi:hypothetical protein
LPHDHYKPTNLNITTVNGRTTGTAQVQVARAAVRR